MFRFLIAVVMVAVAYPTAFSQTRDEMVREDRRKVTEDGFWIYNDLAKAFRLGRETGKPILVVLRCIPCHECVKLDDDLVDKDPVIRPLLDKFVCVRQVSTNGLDLDLFQYDTDQSFAMFMLNADGTIYGRFGTRSHRTEWLTDVSLEGLAKALSGALELHAEYPSNRAELAGKRGGTPEVPSPERFPTLKDRFTDALNYQGDVAKSCIHCHQIAEAQREFYWHAGKRIPEQVMFPYPHPKSLGLILDPEEMATVKSVTAGSIADKAGLSGGDQIESLDGQPLLSMADVQWVLHQADPEGAELAMQVNRGSQQRTLTLQLPKGWRQLGDLSWRTSSWAYRRITAGGMRLNAADEAQRRKLGLKPDQMALRADGVGRFGPHGTAKRAGIKQGDVIVEFDGRKDLMSEQQLHAYVLNHKRIGDPITLRVRRGDEDLAFKYPVQR